MASTKVRPLGVFYVKLLAIDEDSKNPSKRILRCACEGVITQGNISIPLTLEQSESLGGTWRAKRDLSWLEQHKGILKSGGHYEVRAAIDTYHLESGSTGSWYDVLEFKPRHAQASA